MRVILTTVFLLFAIPLLGWANIGEWEGTAELEIISDANGVAKEFLDIVSDLSLELSLDGLDIELVPAFVELISDVRQIKISDLSKALEGIEVLKDDVKGIKDGNIEEQFRLELVGRLDSIRRAIEKDQSDEAVSQLREFRESVWKAYAPEPGEEQRLKRKADANRLRSKAKTAIRNINNIEGLKEDVIDFTCPSDDEADSKSDCIPIDLAEGLKSDLDMAKDAVERRRNASATGWLLDFIDQVEEGHSEGSIISDEADSLISRAETIIGKIDKGKRERELRIDLSATIAEIELAWGLQTEKTISPVPGRDNQDMALGFAAGLETDDLKINLELDHQRLDFLKRWSKERGKLVDGLDFEAELDLGDLELTRVINYEAILFPEGIGKEIERSRVDETKRAIERLIQEIEGSPSIPSEVKKGLIKELQSALEALVEGQRDKVVNDLWDFIDLVERRRREEEISEDDTNWLIAEARAILPRQKIKVITVAMQTELGLETLGLEIEYESTVKDLPAETKKNERNNNLKAELEIEGANPSLTGTIERRRKRFPNDRKKDELFYERQIEAEVDLGVLEITGIFRREKTDYPNNSVKNNVVKVRDLELALELDRADCTLSFEREATHYPNNGKKDKLIDALKIKLEFAQPDLTIDMEREATTYPNDPVKDKLVQSAEFQLDQEIIAGLRFSLIMDFVMENYPNDPDPAKDKTSVSLGVTLQEEF